MEMEGVSASNFSVEIFSLVLCVVEEDVDDDEDDEDDVDEEDDTETEGIMVDVVVESDTFTKQEGQHSPGMVKLYSPWLH